MKYYQTMNTIQTISTEYLRASRTIETVLVTNTTTNKLFYIYNYEGWFYRVFNNLIDLNNFFDDAFELAIWLEEFAELDNHPSNYS